MPEIGNLSQIEVGRYLSVVRERAKIKQAELARRMTWSAAVLSRVEAGERSLAPDELQTILEAIATPEAAQLSDLLRREWSVLPRPPLDHPDQDLLWAAEQAAKELSDLRDQPDVRQAFQRRLSEYLAELQHTAALLLKRDHQLAFIGSIGIGKSTAICRLTELEVPNPDGGLPTPVLEAGAGGVTICEVHLSTGPGYGLMIVPRSDAEIRADVSDFAEHILKGELMPGEEGSAPGDESQGISKEIERAIRNMAKLRIRREKGADGKTIRRDDAKELGKLFSSPRELIVEVLSRMELHRRDSRDLWYDSSSAKTPLVWLKDTFELINNGRHKEFSLPKRIEVVVPRQLLGNSDLSIRIIDTKGIDRTAARADLEVHLDDPHTLAVLCSGFNNAPAAEPRLLLERANEAGVRTLDMKAALLILPRPNEALAVKDESGLKVETVTEGYELKGEQIAMALEPISPQEFAIGFYNAHQDDPEQLREFLAARLNKARQTFRDRIKEVTDNSKALLVNHEQEEVQEVLRAAAGTLKSWVGQSTALPSLNAHIQDSLMEQIARAYASTIRASVRREGEWPNLDYSHHLGFGARRMAAHLLGKRVEGFAEVCLALSGDPEYAEATDLIDQSKRVLQSSYEELLRKVQLMGQTSFQDELKLDAEFWAHCNAEWGRGSGYRDRVAHHNEAWFKAGPRLELENELRALIEREWENSLRRVTALFDTDEGH
jgi:transcriptional regulator with XRE-family HTH domain